MILRFRCYAHNVARPARCATPLACLYRGLVADFAHWLLRTVCIREVPRG